MSIERGPQFEPQPDEKPEVPIGEPEQEKVERKAKDEGYDDDGYSKPSSDDEGYPRFKTPEGEA